MSGTYDNARHQVRQMTVLGDALGAAVLTTGTNTATVEVFRYAVPRKITVDEGRMVFTTGATGSVTTGSPAVLIQKATTSATTTIGSYAFTASTVIASKDGVSFTVTSTDFAAGDHLIVAAGIGTIAATGAKAAITVGWKEAFPSTADPSTGS